MQNIAAFTQQNPGTRTEALRTHTITPIHSSRQVLIQVDVRERPKTGSGSDALTVAAFTQQSPGVNRGSAYIVFPVNQG